MALWTLTGEASQWTGALIEGQETSSFVCLPPGDYEFSPPEGVSRVRTTGGKRMAGFVYLLSCACHPGIMSSHLRKAFLRVTR